MTKAEEAAWRAAYHARHGTWAEQAAAYEAERRRRDRRVLYIAIVAAISAVIAGWNQPTIERLLDRLPFRHLTFPQEMGVYFLGFVAVIGFIGWGVARRRSTSRTGSARTCS